MPKIQIARKKMVEVLEKWPDRHQYPGIVNAITNPPPGFTDTVYVIDTMAVPKELLQLVLDHVNVLSDRQRVTLHTAMEGAAATIDMVCGKPADVHTMIASLKMKGGYNAEMELNGRWYPINVSSRYSPPGPYQQAGCSLTVQATVSDAMASVQGTVTAEHFTGPDGTPRAYNGKQILEWFGLRHLQQDTDAYEGKLSRASTMERNTGQLVGVTNSVLIHVKGMWGSSNLAPTSLGSEQVPKKVVIDREWEVGNRVTSREETKALPFVRLFSLDLKAWVYADVDDLQPYKFDDRAAEWLVLQPKEKQLLTRLFTGARSEMFGDVLSDKHGGMIILANGPTGVGKTLTAEVFAEINHAPLYVMEMAELGVDVNKIEENLIRIFGRVTRWGAILLLDEADIFLAERGESLQRAVIVGIFLRLMDYYKGLLFMTSNRAEVIDTAFKSRITIRIDYPKLDRATRQEIWQVMLHHAGIKIDGDLNGLPDIELNGRQIRNMVRLTKVIHGNEVTIDQLKEVSEYACR